MELAARGSSAQSAAPAPKQTAPSTTAAGPKPKLHLLGVCILVGVAIYAVSFLVFPDELLKDPVKRKSQPLFAIFVATIVGIILQPLPLGAVALMGLCACMVTGTLTLKEAFAQMGHDVPWIILLAFFFSRGFLKTGLGSRIAYLFVAAFGSTTLGLAYALVAAELMMAPGIPSISARAGGIFMPMCKALSEACGSRPDDGTAKKVGSFLLQTSFQCSCVTSGMFLTAFAANPLTQKLSADVFGCQISWGGWALACSVPGLVNIALIPLVLYVLDPPEMKVSPDAPANARKKLAEMGPVSRAEMIMAACLGGTVMLWICGGSLGVNPVAAAILGLSGLLLSGVLTWKECLAEGVAWDTLTWFGALIVMAEFLQKFGFIEWMTLVVKSQMESLGLSWQLSLLILVAVYYYTHYIFASGVAHILAMYVAFVDVAVGLGAPPMVACQSMASLSVVMGGLTHFGIGSAPPFFGAGYVSIGAWWTNAFVLSVMAIGLWLGLGGVWWWYLGYFEPGVCSAPGAPPTVPVTPSLTTITTTMVNTIQF